GAAAYALVSVYVGQTVVHVYGVKLADVEAVTKAETSVSARPLAVVEHLGRLAREYLVGRHYRLGLIVAALTHYHSHFMLHITGGTAYYLGYLAGHLRAAYRTEGCAQVRVIGKCRRVIITSGKATASAIGSRKDFPYS